MFQRPGTQYIQLLLGPVHSRRGRGGGFETGGPGLDVGCYLGYT